MRLYRILSFVLLSVCIDATLFVLIFLLLYGLYRIFGFVDICLYWRPVKRHGWVLAIAVATVLVVLHASSRRIDEGVVCHEKKTHTGALVIMILTNWID